MTATNEQKAGLANLSPAEPGNVRAVTHGAHSERLVGPIASDIEKEVEALCAGTPGVQLPDPVQHQTDTQPSEPRAGSAVPIEGVAVSDWRSGYVAEDPRSSRLRHA